MTSSTAIRISAATSKFSSTSSATGRRVHLEIIASDVRSSWGQLPDFVICDELCHWAKPDLWYSLLSSAAKKPTCVLTVLTNAGIGRGWQWDIREAARTSPDWHFSSLQGSQAPWISDKDLAEQERLLPRPVFDRLWRNLWQHSDGEFVTLAEAEGCCDPSLTEQAAGRPGRQYFAALDYAEKIDRTVGVILHREGERLIVDRMDVVDPCPNVPPPSAGSATGWNGSPPHSGRSALSSMSTSYWVSCRTWKAALTSPVSTSPAARETTLLRCSSVT